MYHWKTFRYATHKATDELHEKLSSNVDTFVETMLGKGSNKGHDSRVNLTQVKSIHLKDFNDVKDFKREINDFAQYLIGLNNTILFKQPGSSDLITIRDEMLQDVNQFLYLLTFY